jgi:hypothetical protein
MPSRNLRFRSRGKHTTMSCAPGTLNLQQRDIADARHVDPFIDVAIHVERVLSAVDLEYTGDRLAMFLSANIAILLSRFC